MPSSVSLYHVATGKVDAILRTEMLVEAPNWTRDGALIVNGEGRLWRIPLDAPKLDPMETGLNDRLNNDHGLSPDGRWIWFSDHSQTKGACIYRMPAKGGAVERVSTEVPSWWHGVSQDGARITYTCVRRGLFGIATAEADGSDERVLISSDAHYDGPDYAPDGSIWFNATRDGAMKLWRMGPEGEDPCPMTDGSRDAWFPHPSPDGQHVLYLTYEKNTEGHPRDRDVELRLMDPDGGNDRSATALFGGQGTINVPCWEPGGARFAFVSYG